MEKEYEDVGRKVLDTKDLSVDMIEQLPVGSTTTLATDTIKGEDKLSMEFHDTPNKLPNTLDLPENKSVENSATELDKTISDRPRKNYADQISTSMPPSSTLSSPRTTILTTQQLAEALLSEGKRERNLEEREIEEFLGISYRSFACGSVALFVPTPFGDYIAFHEGCPHYYLSDESIEAFKRDEKYNVDFHSLTTFLTRCTRNPPYVLGCIVYVEDYVTTKVRDH